MKRLFFILCFLCSWNDLAGETTVSNEKPESARLSLFLQSGISFLGFDDRDKFQEAVDTIYNDLKTEARTEAESLAVSRQDFQKVNLAIPLYAGLQAQLLDNHFLSLGMGFIYDNESIVLTDKSEKTHNYHYTLQAVPLFLEYRLAIPSSIISLSDSELFSVSLRFYWMLPGTEIYSSWGVLKAENSPLNGFGLSLGYLIGSWKGIKIYGDLGFNSITIESNKPYSTIVPIYTKDSETKEDNARWDLGGLQLQIRVSFGVIESKPKQTESK